MNLTKEQLIDKIKTLESELALRIDTEQKKQEAQERYKGLANATFEAVFISENGVCSEVNQTACELFGYDYNEFIGKPALNLFSGEYKKVVQSKIETGSEEPYTAVAKRKDGSTFYCEIRGKMTDLHDNKVRITALRDIDEKLKTTKALSESELKYKTLYQASRDAIMILTPEKGFFAGNQATVELFGCENEEEFVAQEPASLSPEKQPDGELSSLKSQKMMTYALNNGSHYFEWVHKRLNGSEFYATVLLTKMKLEEKDILQATVRDITTDILAREELQDHRNHLEELVKQRTSELEQINIQLKETKNKAVESDNLKSAFLSNMSHEIRTPMNSIIGFSDLLKDPETPESNKNSYINIIIRQGNLLLKIIEDIIDISKIQADKLEINKCACNISDIINDIYVTHLRSKELNDKPGIKFQKTQPQLDEPIIINSDPFRLKQILSNLIVNAIKFTSKGNIEIGFFTTGSEDNKNIKFYVKDTGIGIACDKMDVIFDRFRQIDDSHTRQFGGTGLGLTISKKLVELLGGEIGIDSKEGNGSTFYFTIPYDKTDIAKDYVKSHTPEKKSYLWSDKTILIVEDDFYSFTLLQQILKNTRAKIIHALNGKKAVNICNNGSKIDLVIMDIQLPEMNGYDALKLIKSNNKDIPVIAQTAYALAGEKEKCLESGFDGYIPKPIKRNELLEMIKKLDQNPNQY